MEVSGVVARQVPCFLHRQSDAHSSSLSFSDVSLGSGTRDIRLVGHRNSATTFTYRTQHGAMNSRFCDEGHLQYYLGPGYYGKSKEKVKQKEKVKKELKLLKGLSGDLLASSQMGSVLQPDDHLIDEFQGKLISVRERMETLVGQLQQLKAEEKELKRKRKQEKAKLKAARMQTTPDSSTSSSESSENEGEDVIGMSYYRRGALSQPFLDGRQSNTIQESTMSLPLRTLQQSLPEQNSNLQSDLQNRECCTRTARNRGSVHNESSSATAASGQRVEVCMGNKCRKAGAAMLLEEFEKVLGVDGAVCGCKCMGKCRDGPNVRVLNSFNVRVLNSFDTGRDAYPASDDTATSLTNSLSIGVRLEDVRRIVANLLEQGQKDSSLTPAT